MVIEIMIIHCQEFFHTSSKGAEIVIFILLSGNHLTSLIWAPQYEKKVLFFFYRIVNNNKSGIVWQSTDQLDDTREFQFLNIYKEKNKSKVNGIEYFWFMMDIIICSNRYVHLQHLYFLRIVKSLHKTFVDPSCTFLPKYDWF